MIANIIMLTIIGSFAGLGALGVVVVVLLAFGGQSDASAKAFWPSIFLLLIGFSVAWAWGV